MKAKTMIQSTALQFFMVVIFTVITMSVAWSETTLNDNVFIKGELFLENEIGGITFFDGSCQTTATAIGPQGSTGPIGATGLKGDTGDQGATGATGTQGPTGAIGPQGLTGPIGATGLKGDPGDQGATGATGPQGNAGVGLLDVHFGDGSGGAYTVAADDDWSDGGPPNQQFTTLTIIVGATLTLPSGTVLRCTEKLVVNGTIEVKPGIAGAVRAAPGKGLAVTAAHAPSSGTAMVPLIARQLLNPGPEAGGAGNSRGESQGGDGGGALSVRAKGDIEISADGIIKANGGDASSVAGSAGAGGGAGGFIVLLSRSGISNLGNIEVRGGNGSQGQDRTVAPLYVAGGDGGGGGGGIIHLLAPANTIILGITDADGGSVSTPSGTATGLSAGGGGGALGGNGGSGAPSGTTNTPASGSVGLVLQTEADTPDNLLF